MLEYGSYVAFAEHKNRDTWICIWQNDDSDDISIPLGCAGKVYDLDQAGSQLIWLLLPQGTSLS